MLSKLCHGLTDSEFGSSRAPGALKNIDFTNLVLMRFVVGRWHGRLVLVIDATAAATTTAIDGVAEMIVDVHIGRRRMLLIDHRILGDREVRRLARMPVIVTVVVVAAGRRGALARTGTARARSAAVDGGKLGRGQVVGGMAVGLLMDGGQRRLRPAVIGDRPVMVVVLGLGEPGRVHDRHVNVRYQVQVDHVIVLLEEPAADAAYIALRPDHGQVVGQ